MGTVMLTDSETIALLKAAGGVISLPKDLDLVTAYDKLYVSLPGYHRSKVKQ